MKRCLPAITATGVNKLPWTLISETTVDRKFRPSFAKYLKDLYGKKVSMTGFMQPLDGEHNVYMFMFIENPVGCWYCEMPDPRRSFLSSCRTARPRSSPMAWCAHHRAAGAEHYRPREFLYTIRDAKVADVD